MTEAGSVLQVRYDSGQPQTFTTDSIAMGHDDPYAETLQHFREQARSIEPCRA